MCLKGQRKSKSKRGDVMRLSEVIEEYIKALMGDSDEFVEFGRNELAEYFNCVPSQINYVISTRFSPERGYYVESKRGGGGNIKIKRIDITKDRYIMHLINSIETSLSQQEAEIIIKNLQGYNIIDAKTAKLLKSTWKMTFAAAAIPFWTLLPWWSRATPKPSSITAPGWKTSSKRCWKTPTSTRAASSLRLPSLLIRWRWMKKPSVSVPTWSR